jgi:hypothetical protein
MERLRSPGTDDLIDLGAECGTGHGHGHDDPGGPGAAEDGQGRPDAGAGSHPIIDQEHDPAAHGRGPPVAPIGTLPPQELLPLGDHDRRDDPRRDPQVVHQVLIEDADAAAGQGAEGQLLGKEGGGLGAGNWGLWFPPSVTSWRGGILTCGFRDT